MNESSEPKVMPDKPKEQGELCSKELLGATVTAGKRKSGLTPTSATDANNDHDLRPTSQRH